MDIGFQDECLVHLPLLANFHFLHLVNKMLSLFILKMWQPAKHLLI